MAGDMSLGEVWVEASSLAEALGAVVMILRNIAMRSYNVGMSWSMVMVILVV